MKQEAIITLLKESYPREVRKGLVKSILVSEKSDDKDTLEQQYNLINQIFSYVLKECNWSMPSSSKEWDAKPLAIMSAVFPKLDTTKWYKEQALAAEKTIDVIMDRQK